jgi:hypothetical protein
MAAGFPEMEQKGELCMGALGNDCSVQDYYLDITTQEAHNPWMTNLAVNAFTKQGVMSHEVAEKYSYGGFFEKEFGGLIILSLNTLIYSNSHIPQTGPLPIDPFNQFAWLRERLIKAARDNRPVWIVGHVPPGIETYGFTALWHPMYERLYREIVEDPYLGNFVGAQLFAHLHKFEIRALPNPPSGAGPILISPALSPVYMNNPSFTVVEYDPTSGRLLNYKGYYANLTTGSEPLHWELGFNAAEKYSAVQEAIRNTGWLTQSTMQALGHKLQEGGAEWNTYAFWYTSGISSDPMYAGLHPLYPGFNLTARLLYPSKYRCGTIISTQQEFNECSNLTLIRTRVTGCIAIDAARAKFLRYIGAEPTVISQASGFC